MRTHKRVPRRNLMTPAQAREERRINPWLSLAQGVIRPAGKVSVVKRRAFQRAPDVRTAVPQEAPLIHCTTPFA